jgi:adenylate cyclase
MPGVEIAATAFANLRTGDTIQPFSQPLSLTLLIFMGFLAGSVGRALRPVAAATASGAIAAVYLVTAYFAFTRAEVLIPALTPTVVQFVPALIVGVMLRTLGPRSRTFRGICLQTDIQGSMHFARRPRFKAELKRYYRELGRIVVRHHGTLVRASDDSSISYWRDSANSVRNRERACLAALQLRQHFCHAKNPDSGQFPTRIGLHAGPVTLSGIAVGEARMANLTGDVANTAARLQELCKVLGNWSLASAEAVAGVRCVEFRRIGRFLLIGRDEPIEVVELLAEKGKLTSEQQARRQPFTRIVEALDRTDLDGAVTLLNEYLRSFEDDAVGRFLASALAGAGGAVARVEGAAIRLLMK